MNNFTYSQSGLHLTESFEGCKLAAYQDTVGVWTIGYGHTCDVKEGMACTQEQAELWLVQDVQEAADAVTRLVTVPISQSEFDALTDFVFNVGQGNLGSSTMLKLLNAGDHAGAAAQFARWDKARGVVLAGLLRRRDAEADLFRDA
jgi:lysozyme